ncbi:MAG: hypothetical protein Q9226_008296 [Calogaya cf. arnoldii]
MDELVIILGVSNCQTANKPKRTPKKKQDGAGAEAANDVHVRRNDRLDAISQGNDSRNSDEEDVGGGDGDVEDGRGSGNDPDVDGDDAAISGSEDDAIADYGGQQEPQPDSHGHEEESEHILQPPEDTKR